MTDEIRMPREGKIKGRKWWYYDRYYTIGELGEISGIHVNTICARLRAGWTVSEAVEIEPYDDEPRWNGVPRVVCNHQCLKCELPACISQEPAWKDELTPTRVLAKGDEYKPEISVYDRQLRCLGLTGTY